MMQPTRLLTRLGRGAAAALLACSSAVLLASTRGPDAAGYTATDEIVYSFVDISGASGGASLLGGTDDGTAVLTLPFPFRFYGQLFTMACVSTNGALYFVQGPAECTGFEADFANVDITAAPVPNNRPAALPFWTDLTFQVPGAGAVYYQAIGTAPTRRFVVQWNNAYPQGSSSPVTFQAILAEQGHRVLFQYKSVALGADPASNGGRATVGIRAGGSPGNGQQLAWSVNAPVLGNDTALSFAAPVSDTTGPTVSVTAPPRIWPANNKMVPIQVTGTIVDASGVASARYTVADEYGEVQPSGTIAVGANGQYSVSIALMASRRGTDRDGRRYTITITAADPNGNEGSASAVVVVPHDQR